jgi:hypothetical protein
VRDSLAVSGKFCEIIGEKLSRNKEKKIQQLFSNTRIRTAREPGEGYI